MSDDLIRSALNMSSVVIGLGTACLCLIVEEVDGYSLTSLNTPMQTAFVIGLFVGTFLTSAFLSIVDSAANAVLVCYAADPAGFHANHHLLSEEMKSVWKGYWVSNRKY